MIIKELRLPLCKSAISDADLLANLAIRGTVACFLSLLLRYKLSLLCLAVPARARTMVHTGVRVDPNFYTRIPRLLSALWPRLVFVGARRTRGGLAIRPTCLAVSGPIPLLDRRTFT